MIIKILFHTVTEVIEDGKDKASLQVMVGDKTFGVKIELPLSKAKVATAVKAKITEYNAVIAMEKTQTEKNNTLILQLKGLFDTEIAAQKEVLETTATDDIEFDIK